MDSVRELTIGHNRTNQYNSYRLRERRGIDWQQTRATCNIYYIKSLENQKFCHVYQGVKDPMRWKLKREGAVIEQVMT